MTAHDPACTACMTADECPNCAAWRDLAMQVQRGAVWRGDMPVCPNHDPDVSLRVHLERAPARGGHRALGRDEWSR